jgi:hypothetical protein
LLVDSGVQVVVLNACDTAKTITKDSNLAAIFTFCGVPNIVAMSFALMSDTAPLFMVPLYRAFLIDGLDLRSSVSIARQNLRENPRRMSRYFDEVDVSDYFIPVLYQNQGSPIEIPSDQNVAHSIVTTFSPRPKERPEKSKKQAINVDEKAADRFDLLGRDAYLLYLEILFEAWDIVMISAPPGIGKTAMMEQFADWWIRSKYFKEYYRCRFTNVDASGDECSVLMELSEFQKTAVVAHESSETIKCKFSGLVVVDEVPSFDRMSAVEKKAYREIIRIASTFLESKDIKLVFLARNWAQESRDSFLKVIRLSPLSLEDAIIHARAVIKLQNATFGDQDTLADSLGEELEKLVAFHACDLHFINIFFPLLEKDRFSLPQLFQDLQLGLPKLAINRMNALQSDLPDHRAPGTSMDTEIASKNFLSYFDRLVTDLQEGPGLAYWCLLSIASFQKLLPVFMRSAFAHIIEALVMPCTGRSMPNTDGSDEADVEHAAGNGGAMLSPKNKLFLSEFDRMTQTLKAWGMAQDATFADVLDFPQYLSLHPCLPYLIRHHLVSAAGCKDIDLNVKRVFWTVYELQRKFPSSQSATLSILVKDGFNVRNALYLTLKHRSFGLKNIELFSSFFPPYMELKPDELTEWLKLLTKAVERFELLAGEQQGAEPPRELEFKQQLLCWALMVVWFRGQLMQQLDVEDEDIYQNALRGVRFTEFPADDASIFAWGPPAEVCKILLRMHLVRFRPIEERGTPENLAEVKQILETDPPSDVSQSFLAATFYLAKVALVLYFSRPGHGEDVAGHFIAIQKLAPHVIQAAIDHIAAEPSMAGFLGIAEPTLEKLRDRAVLSGDNPGSSVPEDDRWDYRILKGASSWPGVKLDLAFLKYRGGFPSLSSHAKLSAPERRRQLGTLADQAKKTGDVIQEIRCREALFDLGMEDDDYELCTTCYSRLEDLGALPNVRKLSSSHRSPVFQPIRQGRIQRLLGCMLMKEIVVDKNTKQQQQRASSSKTQQIQTKVKEHFDMSLEILERLEPSKELALTLLALHYWELDNGNEAAAELFEQRVAAMEYGEPPITMDYQCRGRWALDTACRYALRNWPVEGDDQLMLNSKEAKFETDQDPNRFFWRDCAGARPPQVHDKSINADPPALFEEAQYVYLSPQARSGKRVLKFWQWNDDQGSWRLKKDTTR